MGLQSVCSFALRFVQDSGNSKLLDSGKFSIHPLIKNLSFVLSKSHKY